jgi:hypothetical protein
VAQFAANTLLVIPKPVLSARNLLAASGETADSSRDPRFGMTILLGFFKLRRYRKPYKVPVAENHHFRLNPARRTPNAYR